MRILVLSKRRYINRDLIDDAYGRLYHLPSHWSSRAEVRVICMDYSGRPTAQFELQGFKASSRPLLRSPVRSILDTVAEAQEFSPDIIVASSDIVYGMAGLFLARRVGAKFVFDLYDDYRLFSINRYSGAHLIFGSVCRRADLLLCASATVQRATVQFNPRSLLVPNGYDPGIFWPGRDLTPRNRLGIRHDELLLIYPGSPVGRVDVKMVAQGLEELNRTGVPARALFVGDGTREAVQSSPLITAHPPVGQSAVAELIRAADIGIAPYLSTPLNETAAPCKLVEFLACGLPVVAAEVSDLGQYTKYGVAVHAPGDVRGFVAAVRAQVGTQSSRPPPGFSWSEIADSTFNAFCELVQYEPG